MDVLKILKFIVLLLSFVMFCYQLDIATMNLMDPPTVDSTYERAITDDDSPMITICPTNQSINANLAKLGYFNFDGILTGYLEDPSKHWSWGAHQNITFYELLRLVYDWKKLEAVFTDGVKFAKKYVFIPGLGFCKESTQINVTKGVLVWNLQGSNVKVLLTNKNYRSYTMPDISSHIGSKINFGWTPPLKLFFNVKIQERNFCKNDDNPMTKKEFEECVDDKIQKEFEQNNIECVPPWLSARKQCDQIYPETFYGGFKNTFVDNYVEMVSLSINTKIEEECRQSCKETTYTVNEKGSREHMSIATISFNPKVLVTEKVPNYDMFKYIIDVGSSMGLWLGLSVLGLHDLVVWAVQFTKTYFIIRKIRSAVTK